MLTTTVLARRPLAEALTTASCDTPAAHRVRGLLAELADIDRDRAMAARFDRESAHGWLVELGREERDVWEHLHEALAAA